jgi:hypothetical protein
MELKLQFIYQGNCVHAQRSKHQLDAALHYLSSRLARQSIYLRVLSKQGTKTRVYVNGLSPFRAVNQTCSCGQQDVCDGFSYDGEFFSHLTEAVVKDVVLEFAITQTTTLSNSRHANLKQQSHNRQTLSCCGSGCADCPY